MHQDEKPRVFEYPNGSKIVLAAMPEGERIFSTQPPPDMDEPLEPEKAQKP